MSLREAAQQALEVLESVEPWEVVDHDPFAEAVTALSAALAEPTSQESRQVEPVAWRYIPSERLRDVVLTSDPSQARLAADYGCEVQPLYPAPPKREPLSGIEIQQIELKLRQYSDYDKYDLSLHDFARAVERAHGIGGEK